MEGTVARSLQILIALSGAYLAALWVVLIVWTYRDSESRSRSIVTQAFSTMLAAFFFVPGVLLYMVLRPKETLDATFQRSLEEEYLLQDIETRPECPNCHRSIAEDFVICPHCHTSLQQPCTNCGRAFNVGWSVCPYCAHDRSAPVPTVRPVVQPLDRYVRAEQLGDGQTAANVRLIEELEAQAFYRLEPVPQPVPVTATNGRSFDRRKTREMHRARQLNGRIAELARSNGATTTSSNGHAPSTNGDANGNDSD